MKDNITLILGVLILVLMLFIIYSLLTPQNGENEVKTVVSTDTITIHDTVEIKVPVEKIEYKEKEVIDTLYLPTPQDKDTLELPIEQKLYEDSISRIWISGYEPTIDSIIYYLPEKINYIDRVVEVEREKKWYEDRFVIFAGTSAGYGIFSKQLDIYVGVGVGIRLY